MSASTPTRQVIYCLLILCLFGLPLQAWGQPAGPRRLEAPASSPEALPKILGEATGSLKEKTDALASQAAQTGSMVTAAGAELDHLQVAVASLKAALAVKGVPLSQVPEVLVAFAQQQAQVKNQAKGLDQEIDEIKKTRDAEITSQNTLRGQISIIQSRIQVLPAALQQAYLEYLQLADREDRLQNQVLHNLEQQRQGLAKQEELLAGVLPQLRALEETWKAELLQRPAQAIPWQEQIARIWGSVAALPARAWHGLTQLLASGLVGTFFWMHLTHFLGLSIFIVLLAWSTRRLNRLVTRKFQTWRAGRGELDLLPLFTLGRILISNLLLLGLILWVGLFLWILGMLSSPAAQLCFFGLLDLWALRLTSQWVQACFAGKNTGGLLALDNRTARFYRWSLQLLLAYLFLGIFGLKSAAFLGFLETSRIFLWHIFLVIFLGWVYFVLRRTHLDKLLPELPEPAWLHHPVPAGILRGLVLFLLAVIILVDLLGFENLSIYLAWGATWTLLDLAVLWLLWLAGETGIRHLLHPEKGWARQRYPEKQELVHRVYVFSRWALALVLGAAVVFWSLGAWGIKPEQIAWAFRWVTWGPTLGPARLTPLNVGGAILVLYLGLWLSRVARGLMLVRIFPRTALDTGVQYTISTTLHYAILILAGLIVLNILGFPLTNLALVAGALGVGIGFGLQNIVNNFISGLILLFERPIKVGDMLVIDGQWGTVKEIRVRSTIFETFDRSVLIIPNSELVSQKVINWTHYGRGINRLTLKVSVGCNSDVRQVTQLLTALCQANPRVVAEPPPQTYFAVYGESSLDFTVWAHVKTPSDRVPATHELNTAILEAFQAHGIDIPFPQRDLHIKDWPEALERKRGEGVGREPD